MRLYLDDDTADAVLFKLLVAAGHDVVIPTREGTSGHTDPYHLIHSIKVNRPFVTRNHKDFKQLHDLIRAAGGSHRGLLVIRRDNDSSRDLTTRGIANAIRKLEVSGDVIENTYIILNHYR